MQTPIPSRASWFTRMRQTAGLDFHVFVTLLSRGWTVIAGATTVILLPLRLGSTEQGYYYTITSLLGLQILFEMGLGQVIIQLVGHEVAHLESIGEERFAGEAARVDRLASLMQLLRRWYRIAAALFGLLAGVGGGLFLAQRGVLPLGQWLGTWCVMMACTAANLTYVPALAMLEGCGRIGQVARLRMLQSVVGYGALWISLVAGAGLWSAIMVPLASALSTGLWLRRVRIYNWLINQVVTPGAGIAWRRDVMPFQARIAISAMSGYFLFYAFTPLIFANRGAVEAGRFGIAMTVFNALAAVGTSWIYAKTPTMAMHIARGERRELDAIFFAVFKRSLVFTTVAAAGVVLCASLLSWGGVRQMARIASPGVLCCLALVCVANCVIFSLAAYMRAHREEPMHGVSVTGAIATVLVAYFGSRFGVLPMSAAYLLVTAGMMLPWTIVLFRRYNRRSH